MCEKTKRTWRKGRGKRRKRRRQRSRRRAENRILRMFYALNPYTPGDGIPDCRMVNPGHFCVSGSLGKEKQHFYPKLCKTSMT
jgi:hypothetical protein